MAEYPTQPERIEARVISRLVEDGQLGEEQLSLIADTAAEISANQITTISRLGLIGDDTLFACLSDVIGWPLIQRVSECPAPEQIIAGCQTLKLNVDWCIENGVFVTTDGELCHVYTDDPFTAQHFQVVQMLTANCQVSFSLLTPAMAAAIEDDISRERAVSELFGSHSIDIAALAEEAPVINLVNSIVERAVLAEASDIHVEPGSNKMTVRFRIDGKLTEFMQQPASRFPAIASRIKLLSQLDIAERRLPQDGRFTTRAGKREFDVRVSTAPDVHGESIVMRLLPKKRDELSLNNLGFSDDHLALIREWGQLSNGIVLVTGPTGSGKSTTLYALLSDIKTGEEKIVTVEDPVEYQLEGITQVQARADIGYTFAKALRAFLRQDPDIIMVGEIRDKDTADIAVQSSLTGHLVLSTLHTNDASSVFPRLADIGVEPYLTAATIQGVQAQRLVRKLCQHCAEPAEPPAFLQQRATVDDLTTPVTESKWKKAVGCTKCHGRGYRGRIGIYELIPVTSAIRTLIAANADVARIRQQARDEGYRSLLDDGLLKAAAGLTSVDEVLRVCSMDDAEE